MANAPASPLGVYLEHLEKGELGYQFSPDANAAVFDPKIQHHTDQFVLRFRKPAN